MELRERIWLAWAGRRNPSFLRLADCGGWCRCPWEPGRAGAGGGTGIPTEGLAVGGGHIRLTPSALPMPT